MKPIHEQEWQVRVTNQGPVVDGEGDDVVCLIYYPTKPTVTTLEESEEAAHVRTHAIASLPRLLQSMREMRMALLTPEMFDRDTVVRNAEELLRHIDAL